jgi:hypothetical protein
VTALNDIYNIHERYQEPIFKSGKVRYLLEKCQNNHTEFKQTIVLCRTQHTTFTGAVTMLKEACGRLFADVHVKSNRHKRSFANVNTKNNNHNRGNKKMVNGVDTSDLSCWYTNEEMKKLPKNWLQKKIATIKDHQSKNKDKIHEKKKARVNVSAVNTDDGSNNNHGSNSSPSNNLNSIIAGLINGMHNAQHQGGHQFPLNGRGASVAAANRNRSGGVVDNSSIVTFDHLGNPV